jgi:hypothetical protein
MSNEEPTPPPLNIPPNMSEPPGPARPQPGFADKLIPTKNGAALLSYYLGLFSIFPCLGLVMGVVAFISGRKALQAIRETPGLPGSTHAKVGIGCGAIGFLFNLVIVIFILGILVFGKPSN